MRAAPKSAITESERRRNLPPGLLHGKIHTYGKGCRCDPCREAMAVRRRRWRDNNPEAFTTHSREATRKWRLKHKYRLTEEDHAALVERHQGRCAICGAEKPLHIDHDHATGIVRGLLCEHCNRGLGMFQDTPRLLESAAAYIRRAQPPAEARTGASQPSSRSLGLAESAIET